jgi:CO/xanthine dehydrogenase Mo-binding subunit
MPGWFQGWRRRPFCRGRRQPALRHPERPDRLDDDRCEGARPVVAFSGLNAHGLRARDLHRRGDAWPRKRPGRVPAGDVEGQAAPCQVLKLAAEKAGWGKVLPAGRYRGIAVAESFRSYVAQVAEISVDKVGTPRVHRVVCAVDCGVAVNPDQVRAQMEGGIGFGLGAILKSELTLDMRD